MSLLELALALKHGTIVVVVVMLVAGALAGLFYWVDL